MTSQSASYMSLSPRLAATLSQFENPLISGIRIILLSFLLCQGSWSQRFPAAKTLRPRIDSYFGRASRSSRWGSGGKDAC
jgi:hypothetical protein